MQRHDVWVTPLPDQDQKSVSVSVSVWKLLLLAESELGSVLH